MLAWGLGVLVAFAYGCTSTSTGPSGDEHGTIVVKTVPHGEYMQYLPRRAPKGILVIVHGSTEEESAGEADIRKLAETFLQRWVRFADDHTLIAVAPLFAHNFGSWIREPGIALGGYRGLAGKEIGADEFVDRIVERYRAGLGGEERFYLYGHSAGGQFAGRYAVRHPDHLKALVLSAPGCYAFPDPQAPWPYGQKEITVRAGPQSASQTIWPDRDGLAAGGGAAHHRGRGQRGHRAPARPARPRGHDPRRLCAPVGRRDDAPRARGPEPDPADRRAARGAQLGRADARVPAGARRAGGRIVRGGPTAGRVSARPRLVGRRAAD
jgi:pimeloyl-ACP methyl ester carboxylesterase